MSEADDIVSVSQQLWRERGGISESGTPRGYANRDARKVTSNLEAMQSIMRPIDGEFADGSAFGANTYFSMTPIKQDGVLRAMRYWGKAAGTGFIRIGELVSTTMTVVKNVPVPILTSGLKTLALEIPVTKGQYVGFYGPNLVSYLDTATDKPDGFGYYRLTGDVSTSGTVTAITAALRLQLGFDITFQAVTTTAVSVERTEVRRGIERVQYLGRPIGTPLITRSGITNKTVVFGWTAVADGRVRQIDYFGVLTGTGFWGIFDISGDTKTIVEWIPIQIKLGANSEQVDVPIKKGQAVGYYMYVAAGGMIANGTDRLSDDGFGAWVSDDGRFSTFDDATLSRTFSSEIRFHLGSIYSNVSLNLLQTIKVFGVFPSQSNGAGRALSYGPSIPTAMKWSVSGQAFQAMADPTGNDASSEGSAWPRFAEVFQELTGYRVAIVNLAVGATHLIGSDWANTLRAPTQTEWESALTALDGMLSSGYTWEIGGLIGVIGEWDANSIDAGTPGFDKATYKTAYKNAITWARSLRGMNSETPFLLNQTGMKGTGDTTGYQQVREAQDEIVQEDAFAFKGWGGAKAMVARNMMMGTSGADQYHYKYYGYDEMGQSNAIVASRVCVGGR